jgi:hypothetical protein
MLYRVPRPLASRLLCVAAASIVSACGGGGMSPAQTAAVKQPEVTPTPTPAPEQSPTQAQPLALTPLVALGAVDLISSAQPGLSGLRSASRDRYASSGTFQLNGTSMQVTQALTGADVRLSVVSDPSDRKKYLVLLRLTEASKPEFPRQHVCGEGNWRSDDLGALFGNGTMVIAPCDGSIQFVDNGSAPHVVINQVKVPATDTSMPSAILTAHLDTTLGAMPFGSYDGSSGLFNEAGQTVFDLLEVAESFGRGSIGTGTYTFRLPVSEVEPAMRAESLADGQGLEIIPIYISESGEAVLNLVRLTNKPEQFLLYMALDAQTTLSCRAANLSDEQATTILRELVLMGGYATVAPGGPVDVCAETSYTPANERLRMLGAVLTHKVRPLRNPANITVTSSSTMSANLTIRPYR